MSVHLKRFSPAELRLSKVQAWRVLRYFFPDNSVPTDDLTDADRSFAQGLLVEAVDASYEMSLVEALTRSFYPKVPTTFESIGDLVLAFAKAAAKSWFKHATGADLENPRIYDAVRNQLAFNFRSVWHNREAGLDLDY